MLTLLTAEPGTVFTRQRILETVWDAHWYGPTKTLDVHIASVRRKLAHPEWIETVRGVGFRLDHRCAGPRPHHRRDGRPGPMTRRLVLSYLVITLALAVLEIPLGLTFSSRGGSPARRRQARRTRARHLLRGLPRRGSGELPTVEADNYTTAHPGARRDRGRDGHQHRRHREGRRRRTRLLGRRPESRWPSAARPHRAPDAPRRCGATCCTWPCPSARADASTAGGPRELPHSTLDDRVEDDWIRLGLLAAVVVGAVLLVGWMHAQRHPTRARDAAGVGTRGGWRSHRAGRPQRAAGAPACSPIRSTT